VRLEGLGQLKKSNDLIGNRKTMLRKIFGRKRDEANEEFGLLHGGGGAVYTVFRIIRLNKKLSLCLLKLHAMKCGVEM
jgi:hypothetical protein